MTKHRAILFLGPAFPLVVWNDHGAVVVICNNGPMQKCNTATVCG